MALAQGEFAKVKRGIDTVSGQVVAVKIMNKKGWFCGSPPLSSAHEAKQTPRKNKKQR